ncbi:MAG: TonB-dependent receptor [Cytophagaceae bacterium]|jgi:hypothetical protein|nr:TonB-dependent receptor [Cytophagaceae bacterium]
MKHIFGALLIVVISATSTLAQNIQQKHTVSGYLKDSLTTENLIGATIYNRADFAGTSTNQYGFYSLTLPEGSVELSYSFVGYDTHTVQLHLVHDTVININLSGAVHLREVEVTASRVAPIQERTQMSNITLPVAQIKSLPAFLGEVDLMKALQLMPGIQSGGEGSSGLYVRGGGPDQNLILLDGVPVYNVSHLFGFFSVFNADALNNVEAIKGGFPARYGGRVSSVIDVSMKEGNMREFHGEGSLGIVAGRLTLEGPIWKDRTSFIVSGRRTWIDALTRPMMALASSVDDGYKASAGYYFYDLNAKVNHRFSEKDRIYLSAYMGNDRFFVRFEQEEDGYDAYIDNIKTKAEGGLQWGNITSAFRWNHVFTPKLFANTTVTYSRYKFDVGSELWYEYDEWNDTSNKYKRVNQYSGTIYLSGINDWSGKIAFDYIPAPSHYIRFGGNAIYHTFSPGAMAFRENKTENIIGDPNIYGYEYSLYAEDDIRITPQLKVNAGLHWSAFSVRKKFYNVLQPRLSARYLITETLSAKAAYSRMAQYIHLLTNSNIGLPTDLWVPVTNRLMPQMSDQVAAGLAQTWHNEYEISLEGYYKTMGNVIEYEEGASFFDTSGSWEQKVVQGDGRSYGVELFAQKKTGSFTGWLGYTLSWTDRQFEELNEGRRFAYKYDRRHDFSIALMKRFGDRIELSGTWVFGTGNAVTVPIGLSPLNKPVGNNPMGSTSTYWIYGERNSYRMDPYHRLDASISFIKPKRWGERRWIVGVYNAYSRKNPFFIDVSQKSNGRYEYVQVSIFPIIPSISYQFKF